VIVVDEVEAISESLLLSILLCYWVSHRETRLLNLLGVCLFWHFSTIESPLGPAEQIRPQSLFQHSSRTAPVEVPQQRLECRRVSTARTTVECQMRRGDEFSERKRRAVKGMSY